ncbi:MAG: hypothetical protein M0Z51_05155 [Propionibacterium sp.]|nr:hypothetical protein [Propionibacterium sp.]
MADVIVTTKNMQGQVAAFLLDEKDERIDLFKSMKRREELDEVTIQPAVEPAPPKK